MSEYFGRFSCGDCGETHSINENCEIPQKPAQGPCLRFDHQDHDEVIKLRAALASANQRIAELEAICESDKEIHAVHMQRIAELTAQKDGAYSERNKLVAHIAEQYESHVCRHDEDDKSWDDDWRWIVCIHGPKGQMTWHIHDSEFPMFGHLPHGNTHWDGHTTDEKYDRLRESGGQLLQAAESRALQAEAELNDLKRTIQGFIGAVGRQRDAIEADHRAHGDESCVYEQRAAALEAELKAAREQIQVAKDVLCRIESIADTGVLRGAAFALGEIQRQTSDTLSVLSTNPSGEKK